MILWMVIPKTTLWPGRATIYIGRKQTKLKLSAPWPEGNPTMAEIPTLRGEFPPRKVNCTAQQTSFLSLVLCKETVKQSIKHHPYQGGSLLDINVNIVVNGDEFILGNKKYIYIFYHFSPWNFLAVAVVEILSHEYKDLFILHNQYHVSSWLQQAQWYLQVR